MGFTGLPAFTAPQFVPSSTPLNAPRLTENPMTMTDFASHLSDFNLNLSPSCKKRSIGAIPTSSAPHLKASFFISSFKIKPFPHHFVLIFNLIYILFYFCIIFSHFFARILHFFVLHTGMSPLKRSGHRDAEWIRIRSHTLRNQNGGANRFRRRALFSRAVSAYHCNARRAGFSTQCRLFCFVGFILFVSYHGENQNRKRNTNHNLQKTNRSPSVWAAIRGKRPMFGTVPVKQKK